MKTTKNMSKMWIIIIVMISTMIMPLTVAGANNNAPTISFEQMGGEILKQSDSFKNDLNPNGYGVAPITAQAASGSNVVRIYHVWDYLKDNTQTIYETTWPVNKPTRNFDVQVPQTPGLHVLQVQVVDDQGRVSEWYAVPYYIVDKLSGKPDADKPRPTIDSNSVPQHLSTLQLNSKITVKANDAESGIYYIAYAWKKTGAGEPTSNEYTRIYQRDTLTFSVNPPATNENDKTGSWTLHVFAANSTYSPSINAYVMSPRYYFDYEIVKPETVKTLSDLKTEAQGLTEANYTSASWANLKVALNMQERTQTQLENKITAITSARNNLIDISELRTAINNAEATYKELVTLEPYIKTNGEQAWYNLNQAALLYDLRRFELAADIIREIRPLNPEFDARCAEVKTKIMNAL